MTDRACFHPGVGNNFLAYIFLIDLKIKCFLSKNKELHTDLITKVGI